MADSAESLAVESAANARADASLAVDAAVTATDAAAEAAEMADEVITGATVVLAEQAVALAEGQAALATAEAAQVIQAAEIAIANNEVQESWQDEAIKTLQAQQSEMMGLLLAQTETSNRLESALREMAGFLPSTSPNSQQSPEATPTVTAEVAETTATENVVTPVPNADENQGKKVSQRSRVLRFL